MCFSEVAFRMELTNMSYKEEHVNFVSGHNGTSFSEISMLAATTSATLLLREIALLKMSYSIASKLRYALWLLSSVVDIYKEISCNVYVIYGLLHCYR